MLDHWKNTTLSTQSQILVTHAFWCQFLQKEKQGGIEEFQNSIKQMEEFSCKRIRECEGSRSMANREVAKLFLLQYYQDLIRQREAHGNGRPMESLYDKILIRYKWLKEQKIFCCTSQMQQGTVTFIYILIILYTEQIYKLIENHILYNVLKVAMRYHMDTSIVLRKSCLLRS